MLAFDELCSLEASGIFKELKAGGEAIDFRDIFIAATSIVSNCTLATFNKKHLSKIKKPNMLA